MFIKHLQTIKNDFNIENKQITNILLITDKDEINAIAFIQ